MPSIEDAARRWEQRTALGMLGYIQQLAIETRREVQRLSDNFDHLHADVVAIREVLRVPRPECYPDAKRQRAARRHRKTPPADEAPPAAPTQPSA